MSDDGGAPQPGSRRPAAEAVTGPGAHGPDRQPVRPVGGQTAGPRVDRLPPEPDRAPRGVLVVDGSAVQRRLLRAAVEADGDFTVVSEAGNGRDAVALVARLRPAVVLMDLDLPVMGGLEAIERIMSASPTAILVHSAATSGGSSADGLAALAAGAVDVLAEPAADGSGPSEQYAAELRRSLRVAARVRVITHPRGRLRGAASTGAASTGAAPTGAALSRVSQGLGPAPGTTPVPPVSLLVLGASTGGPQALLAVLGSLPGDLDQAVLVVQHMADGFLPGLAAWLDGAVALPVRLGGPGSRLAPGTVTLAPSGGNLLVADDRLRVLCTPAEPGQLHVPGIDQCFASVAEVLGPAAIGVLLSGMGRDGAAGLLALRRRGARTFAQDERTSTVYGMPAAAVALGAVETQLPLQELGPALLRAVGRAAA